MVNDTRKVNSLSDKIARSQKVEKKDCESLKACIQNHTKYRIKSGNDANDDEYLTQLEIVKCILIIGQIESIHSLIEMESLLGVDPTEFITQFLELAFVVLRYWQIYDVQYYDGLMNSVMKQFEDFNERTGNRVSKDIYKLDTKQR